MIVTKKKMKKMKTEMLVVSGIGIATGVAGTTIGTIALVKENRFEKNVTERIDNIEKHVASLEASLSKTMKAFIPVQQTLLENGMLSK